MRLGNNSVGSDACVYSAVTVIRGTALVDSLPPGFVPRKWAVVLGGDPADALSTGTTYYLTSSGHHTNDTMSRFRMPDACVARKLRVSCAVAPGAGESIAFTVRKGGVDTSLTASVTDTNTNTEDATDEVEFAAGNACNVKVVVSAAATVASQSVQAVFECEEVPL